MYPQQGDDPAMSEGVRRDFDKVAAGWDEKPQRRLLAAAVAAGIAADIHLHREMQVLEYGCGTGLCGLQLASEVGHLTAVDTSAGMLEELRKKVRSLDLGNVTPLLISPDRWTQPAAAFDLVFSSMVLHHIETIQTLLKHFQKSLKPGGSLALADLEKEDGTFHDDPTGVAHHGFDPQALIAVLKQLGFAALNARTVHMIRKQHSDDERAYPVFLITGQKPR
jgi:ubiquinone/menaquinone biosynthesis C-methylase UbiE